MNALPAVKLDSDLPSHLIDRLRTSGLLTDEAIAALLGEALDQRETGKRPLNFAYRTLFEQTNDAVFIIDLDGVMVATNQRATELTGYTMEELKTLSFRDLSAEVTESEVILTRLLAGDRFPPYERHFRTKSGDVFPSEVSVELIRNSDGTPQYIQSVVRDITARKQSEAALRASERFLRQVIDSVPHFIFAKDTEGRYLLANRSLAAAYNTTPDDVLGKTDADLSNNPDMVAKIMAQDRQVLETGEPLNIPEDIIVDRQGGRHVFSTLKLPLVFPDGETRAVLGVLTNITELKEAESELRQAYKQSFELEAEKQRVQILTQFIQDSSHEFRTPLSIIGTSLYLITRAASDERREYHARQATEQIDQIIRLLDHLQTMADLDSGIPFDQMKVEVNRLLNTCIETVEDEAREKALNLHLHLDGVAPWITGDAERLVQAFEHILSNAVRFTPAQGTVRVFTRAEEDCIVVEIHDTGIGIPQDQLLNVGKRFWRIDEAHSTPGFGLGLPIAQKIIEVHGGRLDIQSRVGHGTTVTVTLPTEQK